MGPVQLGRDVPRSAARTDGGRSELPDLSGGPVPGRSARPRSASPHRSPTREEMTQCSGAGHSGVCAGSFPRLKLMGLFALNRNGDTRSDAVGLLPVSTTCRGDIPPLWQPPFANRFEPPFPKYRPRYAPGDRHGTPLHRAFASSLIVEIVPRTDSQNHARSVALADREVHVFCV